MALKEGASHTHSTLHVGCPPHIENIVHTFTLSNPRFRSRGRKKRSRETKRSKMPVKESPMKENHEMMRARAVLSSRSDSRTCLLYTSDAADE